MPIYQLNNASQSSQKLLLNQTESTFSFKLYELSAEDEAEETLLREGALSLSDCQGLSFWGDMGAYEYLPPRDGESSGKIVSIDAITRISKQERFGLSNMAAFEPLRIMFFTKYAADTFDEAVWQIFVSSECVVEANVPIIKAASPNEVKRPRIELSLDGPQTIPAGGTAELILSAASDGEPLERPMTFYLTKTNGYLPLKQVIITEQGTVKVVALGLDPGDKMVVKAGYNFWSAVASKTLEVI